MLSSPALHGIASVARVDIRHGIDLVVDQLEVVVPEHDLIAGQWARIGMGEVRVRVRIQMTVAGNEQIRSGTEHWATTERDTRLGT